MGVDALLYLRVVGHVSDELDDARGGERLVVPGGTSQVRDEYAVAGCVSWPAALGVPLQAAVELRNGTKRSLLPLPRG